jgi:subtilase family serine protease
MKKVLIILLLFGFFGCKSTKKTVTSSREKVQTLTITNEIKLDTTIFIPGEKVSLFIPIEKANKFSQVNPKVYTQKNGRATVSVKIDSTGITATSSCDSIAQQLQFYKKQVKELKLLVKDAKVAQTEKKGFSFFQLILYITAFAIVSFVAGYLIKTFKII